MVFPAWVSGLKRPLQIGLAAAVVTAAITLFLPNHYKSEARVLPIEAKGMGGGVPIGAVVTGPKAMNVLGYDCGTVGNHEFNFGLEVLRRAQLLLRLLEPGDPDDAPGGDRHLLGIVDVEVPDLQSALIDGAIDD